MTRSSTVVEDDDWVVDTDAATCEVTDVRRLDRYPLEHIFTLPEKSKLLLLVAVEDDDRVFGGLGMKLDAKQLNGHITISGRKYYRLKCAVSNAVFNKLVTGGVASKMYSQEKFVDNMENGQGGFQLGFFGTQKTAHLTWKKVISNPLSIMFFGPPLSVSRSFDSIFSDLKSLHTIHHLYSCYHKHFFGDVNACLSLQNSYLARILDLLEKKVQQGNCEEDVMQRSDISGF